MEATGTLTWEIDETPEDTAIRFDWTGGPILDFSIETMFRMKANLYQSIDNERLIEALFVVPNEPNERGRIAQYQIMCLGPASFTRNRVLLARTDTIAGRLAITRSRASETGRAIKRCILQILRAWNLARFAPGEVIGWHSIKAVAWIKARTGR